MNKVYIAGNSALTQFNGDTHTALSLLKSKTSLVRKIIKSDIFASDYPVPYAGYFEDLPFELEYEFYSSRPVRVLQKLIHNIVSANDFSNIKIDQVIALFNPYGMDELEHFITADRSAKSLDFYFDLAPEILIQKALKNVNIEVKTSDILILDNTCTSGNSVLGIAYQGIKLNVWKNCLVIAIDLVDIYNMITLKALGALSVNQETPQKASRPFDKTRDGFVKSDGAAIAWLSHLKNQSDNAEVVAFSQTSDAFKLVEGSVEADAIKNAIRSAMSEANVEPDEIAFIKAHGTGTRLNDMHEANAISEVFYKESFNVPVTSLKGHLGHTTDASGLVESILASEMLKQGLIPFTLNCDDPEYNLDIVRTLRAEGSKKIFLSNTSGFGGNNSSLIIKV